MTAMLALGLIKHHLPVAPRAVVDPAGKLSTMTTVSRLLWRPRLFPRISTLEDLANTLRFLPVFCAADDLDLLGTSDQVEFFNDFAINNIDFGVNDEFNFELDKSMPQAPLAPFEFNDFEFSMKQNSQNLPLLPQHVPFARPDYTEYSHFKLNMIGLNTSPYFNDFYPSKSSPTSVVSSESSSLPLDEEMVPVACPELFEARPRRKRRLSSDDDLLPTASVAISQTTPDTSSSSSSAPMKKAKVAFNCPHCNASFKVKGYLTRHLKKHNSSKAFMCPFFEEEGNLGTKCHPTGGFSRRDTYKTHLKALHFIYPPGTKSVERNHVAGRCAGCFDHFETNHEWLVRHIEKGGCKGTINAKKDMPGSTIKQEE
ncbi:transcriptional regulator Stp3p [Diutina catenulata]